MLNGTAEGPSSQAPARLNGSHARANAKPYGAGYAMMPRSCQDSDQLPRPAVSRLVYLSAERHTLARGLLPASYTLRNTAFSEPSASVETCSYFQVERELPRQRVPPLSGLRSGRGE